MADLSVVELKPFVPARDFEQSKRFYADFGFEQRSEGGGIAYFCCGNVAFLLQNFYEPALAENLMLHLLVSDVDAWHAKLEAAGLRERYGTVISAVQSQPWRMRDFSVVDPAGVCWRIGQNVD